MKQITFKRLQIKNFLSVGDTPVEINFRPGMNVITGENIDKPDRRNGVGKSTIADAMHFSLFGETIRELKKDNIINNVTQAKCEVKLTFSVNDTGQNNEYEILRTLKPSKCYIFKDGDDITRDSIQNTNSFISELICSTPDVFQSCVIMTVNNTVPFMAKKKIDKRKFIEGILNLQVFSNMLNEVRQQYSAISKEFDIECARYEEVSKSIETLEKQYISHKNQLQDNKQKIKNRIEENQREERRIDENISAVTNISNNTETKSKITDLKNQLNKCEHKIINSRDIKSRQTAEIMMHKSSIKKLTDCDDVCPTCLRKVEPSDKEKIENEKIRLNTMIDEIKQSIDDDKLDYLVKLKSLLETKINKLQETVVNEESINSRLKDLENEKNRVNKWGEQLVRDLNSDDAVGKQLISDSKNAVSRLDEVQTNIDKIKKELSRLDIIKFIVSEEGVKSYIVKKILQVLNNKLAYYLKQMDSNCICVFNEYFEEQVFDERGKMCSYFNFSGAERKNIDLACLFTFMDIRRLQGDVVYNFSVYDELLDSSLDEKGIDLVLNILKERVTKYNEMIYIISHRKESTTLLGSNLGEVITLRKHKGITTRLNDVSV
jgi:DNA repair exonuclease SbcCD ATPase subunit